MNGYRLPFTYRGIGINHQAHYLLLTIVMQYVWRRWSFDTRDGSEVLIHGSNVTLGHALKGVPRHDLQQVAVEWRREAVCSLAGGTARMQVIEVHSSLDDLSKFRE